MFIIDINKIDNGDGMNIQDLYTFKEVVQQGSISKAAQALNYTQSNVSMKIQQLEKLYNTTFLYRKYNGIQLTPKGEAFYEMVMKMLKIYEKTFEVMHQNEVNGQLRIGSMETTAALHLPKLLTTYHENYKDVDITVITGPSKQSIERVENYELDGAFVAGPIYKEHLLAKELVLEELVIITSSDEEILEDIADLEQSTIIVFRSGCSYRAIFEHWLNEKGIKPKKIMEFGTLEGLLGCVSSGLGVTLLPRSIGEKYSQTMPIKIHIINEGKSKVPTWFVYRKDEYSPAALEEFLKVIENYSP